MQAREEKKVSRFMSKEAGRLFHFKNDIRVPLYYPLRVKETSCVIFLSFSFP